MLDRGRYQVLVDQECARRKGFDPLFIAAIIEIESHWDTYTVRYEPNAHDFVPNADGIARALSVTRITEEITEKMSWGLGQVMGSTARGFGYVGPLPKLCDPVTGIYWMCETFERECRAIYKIKEEQAAAYNAGHVIRMKDGKFTNQKYVDQVMAAYKAISGSS